MKKYYNFGLLVGYIAGIITAVASIVEMSTFNFALVLAVFLIGSRQFLIAYAKNHNENL